MDIKFIVDINVGKLVKWLRMMGYDALLFRETDDGIMIKIALRQNRVVLTKDSQIMKRRVVTTGKLKILLLEGDNSRTQLRRVVNALDLNYNFKPLSRCLVCNRLLVISDNDNISNKVPPYIFANQSQYRRCPSCHRVYWQGTHWQAMIEELRKLTSEKKIHCEAV